MVTWKRRVYKGNILIVSDMILPLCSIMNWISCTSNFHVFRFHHRNQKSMDRVVYLYLNYWDLKIYMFALILPSKTHLHMRSFEIT